MISHLGINPDSGGRPPSDSRVIMSRIIIIGVLFQSRDRVDVEVE